MYFVSLCRLFGTGLIRSAVLWPTVPTLLTSTSTSAITAHRTYIASYHNDVLYKMAYFNLLNVLFCLQPVSVLFVHFRPWWAKSLVMLIYNDEMITRSSDWIAIPSRRICGFCHSFNAQKFAYNLSLNCISELLWVLIG